MDVGARLWRALTTVAEGCSTAGSALVDAAADVFQYGRRDLADPAQAARPVAAIAARWGFRSAIHFNRLFRVTYGLPRTNTA